MPIPTTQPGATQRTSQNPFLRSTRARRLVVLSAGHSDAGHECGENQDRFLIESLGGQTRSRANLFAVADGVGGAAGGAVASTLAIDSLRGVSIASLQALCANQTTTPSELSGALATLFRSADARILEEVKHRPMLSGMATTLCVALSIDRRLFVAGVGDSRCYLLREGKMSLVTHDQTAAAELVRGRFLDRDEEAKSPLRNILTSYVGGGASKLHVEVREHELCDGDVVLLCSDGLTDMVPEETIRGICVANRDPAQACERLVLTANDMGGHDNVTAIVARAANAREESAS